jgi:endonuclease YncB( thermonuclease family)
MATCGAVVFRKAEWSLRVTHAPTPSLRAERSNSGIFPRKDSGLLRFARNDGASGTGGVHRRQLCRCSYQSPPSSRATFELRVVCITTSPGDVNRSIISLAAAALLVVSHDAALATACQFEQQGEGHVAEVVDARSLRLDDGREVRLSGIEPTGTTRQALTMMLLGRDVRLRGADDTPDRYGRQPALVFVGESQTPVQALLLSQGDAIVSAEISDKDCAAALFAAEAEARRGKKGSWADSSVIKNAESPDDILTGIGRFVVVEG